MIPSAIVDRLHLNAKWFIPKFVIHYVWSKYVRQMLTYFEIPPVLQILVVCCRQDLINHLVSHVLVQVWILMTTKSTEECNSTQTHIGELKLWNQRGPGERLYERTVKHVKWTEDVTDHCKWMKMIKDVRWSGWVWVSECFFWYQPTRVVPDQRPLNGCVSVYVCVCHTLVPSVLWRCWLGDRKGIRPVKNWVVGYWHGYLSGARCRLAYGPADATATHCLLLQ